MAINNQPTIQPRTVTGIFTKYIAKTLPLAFDESMSYYECLCALLEYLNEDIVPDINNVNNGLSELQTFYLQLQDYVNTYFDNLDIQEEINNKLDDMAEDGSLTELIEAYVNPIYQEFENDIENRVSVCENVIETSTSNLQQQINHLASGSPLVASSTAGMTDTTKIYVNTTDGHWYWYNSSTTAWTDGGVYQSTGISGGAIDISMLDNNYSKLEFSAKSFSDCGLYHYGANIRLTQPLLMKKGTVVTFGETFLQNYYYRVWKNTNLYSNGDIASLMSYTNEPSTYTIPETAYYTFGFRYGESETQVADDSTITDNDVSLTYYVKNYVTKFYDYSFTDIAQFISSLSYCKWDFSKHYLNRSTTDIQMSRAFKFDNDVTIKIKDKDNYRYEIFKFNSPIITNANMTDDSGWTTDDIVIPANTYFSIRFGRQQTSSPINLQIALDNIRIVQRDVNIDHLEDDISALDDRIDYIEEQLDVTTIPSYFKSMMESKIATINDLELSYDYNGDSFVFITDTHWQNNTKNSPSLIKDILSKSNINKVFFGGDILNLYSTQETAIGYYKSFYKAFREIPMFTILGNHDLNDNVSGTYPQAHLTQQQVYSLNYKKVENIVSDLVKPVNNTNPVKDSFYYYLDNEEQNIRYICLNSAKENYGDTQLAWLLARLSEIDSSWTVVIFTHFVYSGTVEGVPQVNRSYTELINYLTAHENDYNSEIACLIAGHSHYDYNMTSSLGFPVIVTCTDCRALATSSLAPTMTAGTDTEQCFDVVTLDKANRKIYCTRIGAGNDREFSY